MGTEDGEKILPVVLTYFFFILALNLMGLIPGTVTATGNINVTAGRAITAFVYFNGLGMARVGIFKYWIGLVPHGIPILLWPLLFVVEIIGIFSKSAALCVRLFANMVAGHATILGLMGLIFMAANVANWFGFGIGGVVVLANVGISVIEILICFIQAYIFAFLVTIFASMALHPH